MKPDKNARLLLGATRAMAKMLEYDVPEEHRQIDIKRDPTVLLDLTIGILGDTCAAANNLDQVSQNLDLQRQRLLFSSYYFDALLNSKANDSFSEYLKLLGAGTYYLCDFPGSARVLVDKIESPDLEADGLDWFTWSLLAHDFSDEIAEHFSGKYERILKRLHSELGIFFREGEDEEGINQLLKRLRQRAYRDGADRELLFADVATTLCKKKLEISAWNTLPQFTGIAQELWKPFVQKTGSIYELWPAQMLLGKKGVFAGRSAVVQMPTSAGKTKATELIIRSAFLSDRTKLAIIVAPFRALCHEIYDGLAKQFQGEDISLQLASDVLQDDLSDMADPLPCILILTPEKLDYLLRQQPELTSVTGLIVYDEGHLFDDSSRGVKYELLLASLKRRFSSEVQVVLISAVIGNASEISQWLTGDDENCIRGRDLHPTYRTVAFASWQDRLGQLRFVEPEDPDQFAFFVPRILETQELEVRPRENPRPFPKQDEPGHIALYLGCKMVRNGSVAIFAGRKDSAAKMASDIVDAFSRNLQLPSPARYCDPEELKKLVFLYGQNLGTDCIPTKSAQCGIFLHHSNTPHGIRLALEHALQNGKVKFVICTSTLAQGVNLPLRYLIVTTDRQGREKIKIRDFHNLMGRAGRAGMYTEGTIVFSNPAIFDKKMNRSEKWRWTDAKNLLNPERSEPCKSFILALLSPVRGRDSRYEEVRFKVGPLRLAKLFYEGRETFDGLPDQMVERVGGNAKLRADNRASIAQQLKDRANTYQSISAFLVQYMCEAEENDASPREAAEELLRESLAFYQATETQQGILLELFSYLQERILSLEPSHEKRKVFAKTVFDIPEGQALLKLAVDILPQLRSDMELEELLRLFWPALYRFNTNSSIRTCTSEEALKEAGTAWLQGRSFAEVFSLFSRSRFGRRKPTIDHAVEVCENGFGFQGSMIIGACIDLMGANGLDDPTIEERVRQFQKALKYGLPTGKAIAVYEMGLAERALAMELSRFVPRIPSRRNIVRSFRRSNREVREIVDVYPEYFESKLDEILSS